MKDALKGLGISIGTHILECANVRDNEFNDIQNEVLSLDCEKFPVLNEDKGKQMIAKIEDAKANLDSVGGITQTAIVGLPAGVGEPMFDSVEGMLSHAMFAIGAVKGIEFGIASADKAEPDYENFHILIQLHISLRVCLWYQRNSGSFFSTLPRRLYIRPSCSKARCTP